MGREQVSRRGAASLLPHISRVFMRAKLRHTFLTFSRRAPTRTPLGDTHSVDFVFSPTRSGQPNSLHFGQNPPQLPNPHLSHPEFGSRKGIVRNNCLIYITFQPPSEVKRKARVADRKASARDGTTGARRKEDTPELRDNLFWEVFAERRDERHRDPSEAPSGSWSLVGTHVPSHTGDGPTVTTSVLRVSRDSLRERPASSDWFQIGQQHAVAQ